MAKMQTTLSVTIESDGDIPSCDQLVDLLRRYGKTHLLFHANTELAESNHLTHEHTYEWVYVPGDYGEDADTGMVIVNKAGQTEGHELVGSELDQWLESAICDRFMGEFPRFSNGAPHCAVHNDYAIGMVGEWGIKVDRERLVVKVRDRGDDGMPDTWLRLRMTA